MSTQQDIYAAGSESHPPMLNKEDYMPWSSRLLRYAKIRPNGKLIYNSIINGPYVRRMIPEPGDTNWEVLVNGSFHVQTDDELNEKELKQIEADDQAIQTILLGLPEDIYAAIDSCENAQEIWSRVQQMMKGPDIGIQEKKAKHFPEKIASNLKFLNNLQPEWSRHVTIVHQTKDLHTADYTQLYDFLKYNQKEVDELKPERLAKTQDPLALVETSNNPCNFPNFRNQVAQNPRVQNVGNQNGLIGVPGNANQNLNRNGNLVVARAKGNAAGHNGNQIRCYNCRGVDGSAEVHDNENWYDNDIFNMFTQEEQYTELIEPILEPHQVPQNDHNVISKVTSMEQSGETVEQYPANFEETRALYDSLYQNLAIEVEKVNTEKSTVSFLLEEKKSLKSDFKIHKDEILDKQIQLEKKIKELNNIFVKTGQSIQTIHMLSPKPDLFYHTEQKMALGYQNPVYLKLAHKKQ
nr:hypothetical protein [Tanacetum cinerariifolium]